MGNCFMSKPKESDTQTQNNDDQQNLNGIQLRVDQESQNNQKLNNSNNKNNYDNKNSGSAGKYQTNNNLNNNNTDKQNSNLKNASELNYTEDQEMKLRKDKIKGKKMVGEYQEESKIYENIKKIDRQMSKPDINFILKSLGQHFVFSQLNEIEKEKICEKMFYCENTSEYVFKEGDQAASYFIIEKGECDVIIKDKVRRKLGPGEAFGELALLYGAKRSASIKCDGPCAFWAIDRIQFRKTVQEIMSKEYEENRKFIEKTSLFKVMTEQQKDLIAHVTISTQYKKKGSQIVCQGDPATSYFIIKKGRIAIQIDGKQINKMEEGAEFGEQALTSNETSVRGATVVTDCDGVVLLSIGRDQIQEALGNQVQQIMYNNLQKWAFEKNAILCKMTKIQVEKIISKSEIIQKQKDEIIFEKGQPAKKLVFLLDGKIKKEKSSKMMGEKGAILGEEWLFQKKMNNTIDDNIIMAEKGKIAQISHSTFFQIIGGPLEKVLDKNKNSHEQFMKKYDGQEAKKYINWKLEDLTAIQKLGYGQFGSVYLCKHKKAKEYYALKVISKAQVIDQNLEKHLLQEKKVLENVHFPFIMKFIRTFRDNNNVYFLVEYVKGMELFDVIREIGLLQTYDSQFYIGSLILCIEYLHMNSIIYRDIKPENVMIDHKGYVKLIDMGTGKFLKGKGGRTYTIIGTPHYMAPEIIQGKGYTYSVDLWSIGICLYEFMCGGVPFAEDADDPYEIYEEIISKSSLDFPSWLKDSQSKQLMKQLLNKAPEARLGSSYAALKAHSWFDTLDWDKLMRYELAPPYLPPKDKMISNQTIKKREEMAVPILQEIKQEQGNQKYNKAIAKDPNWDKDF